MGDLASVLEIAGHERHAERVTGHQGDGADLAGRDPDVELAAAHADGTLVDDAQ